MRLEEPDNDNIVIVRVWDANNNDIAYNNNDVVRLFEPDSEMERDSELERDVIAVDESEPETESDSEPEQDIEAESHSTRDRIMSE